MCLSAARAGRGQRRARERRHGDPHSSARPLLLPGSPQEEPPRAGRSCGGRSLRRRPAGSARPYRPRSSSAGAPRDPPPALTSFFTFHSSFSFAASAEQLMAARGRPPAGPPSEPPSRTAGGAPAARSPRLSPGPAPAASRRRHLPRPR